MFPLGDADTLLQLPTAEAKPERPRLAKYQLPVGDYEPLLLNVMVGSLEFRLKRDDAFQRTNNGAA